MAQAFRFSIRLFAAAAFMVTSKSRPKAQPTSRILRAEQETRLARMASPCRKTTALPGLKVTFREVPAVRTRPSASDKTMSANRPVRFRTQFIWDGLAETD